MISPKVSIIVTTHLRANLLKRSLKSILNQTINNYEIIVCADLGDKETKLIASNMLRECDIFLCAPGTKGPAATRNIGMQLARGEWICFLDDDDSFEKDFLENIAPNLLDATKLYYTNYSKITENRVNNEIELVNKIEMKHGYINQDSIYIGNFIPNNTFFISKAIAKLNHFDENLQTHEDWDWLLAMRQKNSIEFVHVNSGGVNVHVSIQESRNNNPNKSTITLLDYLSIYRKWPGPTEEIKKIRMEVLLKMGLNISHEFL